MTMTSHSLGLVLGLVLGQVAGGCERLSSPPPPAAEAPRVEAPPTEAPATRAADAPPPSPPDDASILAAVLSVHIACQPVAPLGAIDALIGGTGLNRTTYDAARRRALEDPVLKRVIDAGGRHCPLWANAGGPAPSAPEPIAPAPAPPNAVDPDTTARVLDFMARVACDPRLAADPKALDALMEERGFTAESFAHAAQAAQAAPGFADALVKRALECAPAEPVAPTSVPEPSVPAAVPEPSVPAAVPEPPVPAAVPEPPVPAAVPEPPVPAAVPEPPAPAAPTAPEPRPSEPPPPEAPSPGGCRHDNDCKGERVCVERRCVFP